MLSPSALHHPSVNVMLLSLHIQRCIHVIASMLSQLRYRSFGIAASALQLRHCSFGIAASALHLQRCIFDIAASALHLQRLIFVLLQKLSISPLEAREKAKYRNAFNVTRPGRQGRQGIFELPFNAPSSAL
jgi:hypothetical protein